ncbi:MFS transporter [Sulfobacillus thermosulfidooxidans]|uniref:MFS transporter n=1 Tax=Sulfobacillus thermosulfidooxidans TaxID=28034 RepID=UPI0006B614F2|nr:MFS transporter [Sulfobacillus thermosulfidooxidans]
MEPHNRDNEGLPLVSWRSRNVWGFSLASLFSDMGHELVTTVLPAFLLTIGAPVFALAVIEGVSNFSQSLSALLGGKWANNTQSRRSIVVVGYILTGVKALIAWVSYWPWIVVLRTLAWIGRGARGPIRDTMIADEVPFHDRGKAYGFRETFDTLGAILGPLAATLLIAIIPSRTLIALSAIPAVLTILVIVFFIREPKPLSADSGHEASRLKPGEAISWPQQYRIFRRAVIVFWFSQAAPTFFILRVLLAHPHGLPFSTDVLGFALYTLHNIFYAASSYPAGLMADHGHPKLATVTGYILWTLSLLGFADFHALPVLFWPVLFIFSGLATGLIETGQKTMTVAMLPSQARGVGLGQIAGLKGLSQLIGTLVIGALWTLQQPAWGFLVLSVAAALGIGNMMLVRMSSAD